MCQDVVTSVHIRILYAYTGQLESSDAVITGVQYTYSTEDVAALVGLVYCNVGAGQLHANILTIINTVMNSIACKVYNKS